jgi:hypothetical protein
VGGVHNLKLMSLVADIEMHAVPNGAVNSIKY